MCSHTMPTLARWFMVVAITAVLSACGGGGGTTGSSGGSGTVGVTLTDAPTTDFDHIYVTITGITLLGNGGRQPVLFDGSRTVDLLSLSAASDLFAVKDNIPAGDYSKIRMDVSDVTLVDSNANRIHPKLPSGHIDLNPQGPFTVTANNTLLVQLDADAEKSIHVVKTGNSGQYVFRPVVFVDVLDGSHTGRLVRIHGITQDEGSDGRFVLCPTDVVSTGDNQDDFGSGEGCVQVTTDSGIGVFGPDGKPDGTGINAINTDDELTAIGFLKRTNGSDGGTPGQKDLFDGDYALNAAVVELGTVDEFQRVSGTVDSAVTSDSFDLQADQAVADGSGGTLANPVPVQLYPQTHIYSRDGTAREQTYIAPNQSAMVDSVASGGALNASLVVLGTPPRTGIPGTLATIAPANDSFTMDVSTDYSGGGPAAGNSVTVAVDSATRIVLIDGSDNSLVRLDALSGLTGASVTVYGDYESSTNTVVADTVVVTTS